MPQEEKNLSPPTGAAEDRKKFEIYIEEIVSNQRHQIAKRVVVLRDHHESKYQYFLGCMAASFTCCNGLLYLFGPRHFFASKMHGVVSSFPAYFGIGYMTYIVFYTLQNSHMRIRLLSTADDYEYELKRVKGHHVQQGMDQLAWLQAVTDVVRKYEEYRLDLSKSDWM